MSLKLCTTLSSKNNTLAEYEKKINKIESDHHSAISNLNIRLRHLESNSPKPLVKPVRNLGSKLLCIKEELKNTRSEVEVSRSLCADLFHKLFEEVQKIESIFKTKDEAHKLLIVKEVETRELLFQQAKELENTTADNTLQQKLQEKDVKISEEVLHIFK